MKASWHRLLDGSWILGNGYTFASVGSDGVSWIAHVPARDADLLGVDGPFAGTECSLIQAKQEAEHAVRRYADAMRRWASAFDGGGRDTIDARDPSARCVKCGRRRDDHRVRHPFVEVSGE